jgi:hypothetical protein
MSRSSSGSHLLTGIREALDAVEATRQLSLACVNTRPILLEYQWECLQAALRAYGDEPAQRSEAELFRWLAINAIDFSEDALTELWQELRSRRCNPGR